MDSIIQSKRWLRSIGGVYEGGRILFPEASDRLEVTREVYNPENFEQYEAFELLHESFLKDKMVSAIHENPVEFDGMCNKFRVIR